MLLSVRDGYKSISAGTGETSERSFPVTESDRSSRIQASCQAVQCRHGVVFAAIVSHHSNASTAVPVFHSKA